MKKILSICAFLCICAVVTIMSPIDGHAQKPKDKPPTAAEMKKMIADAKKYLENMDPETKRKMDSMGVKMPQSIDTKFLDTMTDKDWEKTWEEGNRILPKKDIYRIGTIPKENLTSGSLVTYVQKLHSAVANKLDSKTKTDAEKIMAAVKKNYPNKNIIPNTALGLWLTRNYELALYLMGAACVNSTNDKDALNNYASMLIMTGAEEGAIPILNKLNKELPKNKTILNNLAQAWLGLGDVDKAEKYIDSCVRVYALHSQANATKSKIEESKGNKQGAAEAMKQSIKKGFSESKKQKLRQLGYDIKKDDFEWNFPKGDDGLGMGKFSFPPWPYTIKESVAAKPKWDAFKKALATEIRKLELQYKAENAESEKEVKLMFQNGTIIHYGGPLAAKARLKFSQLIEENKTGGWHESFNLLQKASTTVSKWEAELNKAEQELDNKFDPQFGEGLSNPEKEYCEAVNKERNKFLEQSNKLMFTHYQNYTKQFRLQLEEELNYSIHQTSEKGFEPIKTKTKIDWLRCLSGVNPLFQEYGPFCHVKVDNSEEKAALENFGDFKCQFKSNFDFGPLSLSMECNKVKLEVSVIVPETEIGLKGFYEKDLKNRTANGECTISAGIGVGDEGILRAGVDAEIGMVLEVDRNGVSDYGVVSRAKATVGIDGIGNITIVGADARYLIDAGGAVEIKSVLGGGAIKSKSIFR